MKRTLSLLLIGFFLGFLAHAVFLPDVLSNGIIFLPEAPQESTTQTNLPQPTIEPSTVEVTYSGTFDRHNITVPFSRYLVIRNDSPDTQMWLSSDLPSLTTVRGYGESEQVRSRMDKKGQFVVWDTKNPKERLVITVK